MKAFLETKLGLVFDGVWQMREILFLLAAAAFCLLLLALAAQLIQRIVNSRKLKKTRFLAIARINIKMELGNAEIESISDEKKIAKM